MALTKNKEVFIDFTKEAYVPQFAKGTRAIQTASDTQEGFFHVGGTKYVEWIQNAASTALMFEPQTTTPFGWLLPLDAADADGLEMTMGMAASSSAGAISFTVGTDGAFFCRAKMVVTTLNQSDVVGVGFRELTAYNNNVIATGTTPIVTPATMGSTYDDKAAISVDDTSGAVVSHFSVGGVDTQTTATGTPIITAQALEFMVRVSSAGVCTYYIALDADTTPLGSSPTADVLLSVPTQTIDDAVVLVPYITGVSTANGAATIVLQEWEVGYVND